LRSAGRRWQFDKILRPDGEVAGDRTRSQETSLQGSPPIRRRHFRIATPASNGDNTPMIRDVEYWRRFEDDLIRREPADHLRNLAIFDALHDEARRLGAFTANPLEGLEDCIRLARAVNGLRTS
jgi:hypothetical protein